MTHRWCAAPLATLGLAAPLLMTGCSSPASPTVSVCIDWAHFDSPADAKTGADAVVLGTVRGQHASTTYLQLAATKWNVRVDDWIKGDAGSRTIIVTSVPEGCGRTGDNMAPAADAGQVVLFLHDGDDGWETITPFHGWIPAGTGGEIPTAWPADQNE